MADRLAEIKANTYNGDGADNVNWLIAEVERLK